MNKQNEKLRVKGKKHKICSTDFKGITLVALVITIMVLIILSAVSINAVMNEGLMKNAKDAAEKYKNVQKAEQTQLSALLAEIEHYDLPDVEAGGYTGTSNAKYKDEEGAIAIIPAGFTVSGIDSENKISKGLVIYSGKVTDWTTDSDADEIVNAQENNNQYVWIPVENPSDIYGTIEGTVDGILGTTTDGVTTTKFGKLYFGEYGSLWESNTNLVSHYNWPTEDKYDSESKREPAVLSDSDSELNIEFEKMIASVEKYKGFYIGRYELTSTDRTVSTANVVKGVKPLVNTTWFNFDTACKSLESGNDKVRTTMIWGCQWDQAVKMSLTDKSDFLTNAATYGVYSGNGTSGVQTAGTKTAVYNIYDMGGNVWDWTLEAFYATSNRTGRGGMHAESATGSPASCRGTTLGDKMGNSYSGCRAQLYVR